MVPVSSTGGGGGGGGGESLLVSHSLLARGFEVGVVLRGLEGRRGVAESEGGLREKETVVVTVAEGGWCVAEKMVVLVGMEKCEVQKEKGSIVIDYGLFVAVS